MKTKFQKIISVLLSLTLLLSIAGVSASAGTTVNDNNVQYYVKSPGYDNYGTTNADGSEDKPFETVYDLIAYVNANLNLTADDTVNVIIQQLDNATSYNSSTKIHNMTSWINTADTKDYLAAVPKHPYTIMIKSEGDDANYFAYSNKFADNVDMVLGGPTVFDNVKIVNITTSYDKTLSLQGNSVKFTENCSFCYVNSSNKVYDRYMSVQMVRTGSENIVVDAPVDMEFGNLTYNTSSSQNAGFKTFYIPTFRSESVNVTYNNDVTVTIDNEGSTIPFVWGNNNNNSTGTAAFNKNLNFNIKSVSEISNTAAKGPVNINTLQVVYPAGKTFTVPSNVTVTNSWYIENKTGNKDIITFTETAGVYTVNSSDYSVTAVGDDGTTYTSVDGVLTISKPGTYTLTRDYYVKSPGSDNYNTTTADGTKDKPFETVYDLITELNSQGTYTQGDIVNVIIMQLDDATAFNSSTMIHNMTSWSDVPANNLAPVPNHSYTIVVKSDGDTNNYLAYTNKYNANVDMLLGGPTVFDNIQIMDVTSGYSKSICLEGNDVKFTENCTFGFGYVSGSTLRGPYNRYMNVQMVRLYNKDFVVETPVTVEAYNKSFNTGTSSNGGFKNFYIASSRNESVSVTYKEDVAFVIDNANSTIPLVWGNGNAASTTTFEKNVNINIKDVTAITNAAGNGSVVINGGLQVIMPKELSFDVSGITNITASKYFYLKVDSADNEKISFNVATGTFNIAEGYTAVATNVETSETVISKTGTLIIENSGTYTVAIVEAYTNDGSTINVYEPGTIDLSTVHHNEISNKVFIGWQLSDGTYPQSDYVYQYGDVLTAQYTDYSTADYYVELVEMRDDSSDEEISPAIRFVLNETKGLPNILKRGVLMLPVSESYGAELYVDEAVIKTWSFTAGDKTKGIPGLNDFVPLAEGEIPNSIEINNILEETETDIKYTLCLTDLTEEQYDDFYAVRGYIIYQDNNGLNSIFYTNQEVSSLYKAVAEADLDSMTDSEKATAEVIINYVENTRVTNYWTSHGLTEDGYVNETTTTQYENMGCGCYGTEECTHNIFKITNANKFFYVRDIVVDTGKDNFETAQIGFITDNHWSYVDKTDIASNSISLSSYRGRLEMFRRTNQSYVDNGMMEFASIFKKTVNGGDIMDYLSAGALNLVDRLFTKQSVNNRNIATIINGVAVKGIGGSYSAVLGNHDPKKLSSSDDETLTEDMTKEQAYSYIAPKWANDTSYASEILLDSNNNEQVLMVYLDNNIDGTYTAAQYDYLSADLSYARNNSLPVLIFQHRPMLTMNPDETQWKYISEYKNRAYMAPQDDKYYEADGVTINSECPVADLVGKKVSVINMTNYSDYSGYGVDPNAEDVYNLIRKNADIINAVFAGHIHANTESTIMGMTADGQTTDQYTIPQYTGYHAGYLTVQRIILK